MPSLGYLYELFWLMPCCLSVSQITGTNLLRAFSQLYNTCSMFLLGATVELASPHLWLADVGLALLKLLVTSRPFRT